MDQTKYRELDIRICNRLKQGDDSVYTIVFKRYARLLYTLSYRYLKSEEEAEDAVQYVFMKLWEKRESLDFSNGVRSLLYTIMKNYVLNELRHRQIVYEKLYMLAQEQHGKCEESESGIERNDLYELLHKHIKELPTQKEIICRMKIEEGLSNQEIADRLHIEVNTVKSHFTQAIKLLRSIFFVWVMCCLGLQ